MKDLGKKQKLQRLLKILSLTFLSSFLLGVSECQTEAPKLNWNPKIYVGDSQTESYVRQDESGQIEQITCSNIDFDSRIVLSNKEILAAQKAYNEIISKCAAWK